METTLGRTKVTVQTGDITDQKVDAIVNAANSTLLGGGGVDGAIHRRGGPAILEECRALRRTRYPDGLPAGDAAATAGGLLPAKWVVHAVGPRWRDGQQGEAETLASTYRRSLDEAERVGARTIAFPAISTGAYGYPLEAATQTAVAAVAASILMRPEAFDEVRFIPFSEEAAEVYRKALERL
ncbi:MAG: O-acetyl-ADP-ribose deacetylase [Planctomycetaceae bacterium]